MDLVVESAGKLFGGKDPSVERLSLSVGVECRGDCLTSSPIPLKITHIHPAKPIRAILREGLETSFVRHSLGSIPPLNPNLRITW